MQKLIKTYKRLPVILRNKYALSILVFFVWMLFFDRHDLITQWQRKSNLKELKEKRKFLQEEIKAINQDRENLFSSEERLEKFAREKYWMKKDNEDIFVIVED